jgi:UDP-N-acetylmuramoyl-tripeptide--D-alanyl-D-alanine ligase
LNFSVWTLDRVAQALGDGSESRFPRGSQTLTGINTDSRTVAEGELFVALVGEKFDAHDFIEQAVKQGAAAVVSSRELSSDLGVPVYQVPDTLVALGKLGLAWRKSWGGPIVMVAGSNGKTTTKDIIRAALSKSMAVHATTGNLNNRIGVPKTLLSIPPTAEIAVIEAGTNIPGEVAILRQIIDPDISVVTSIGEEHLEGLGDLEGVLKEEATAFDGVRIAITPSIQPEIGDQARLRAKETITAGLAEGDVRADSWSFSDDGTGTIVIGDVKVSPPLRGLHNLRNTMLAIAVARSCGVSDQLAAAGIEAMPQPRMRMAWEKLGDATLINDAYNANPGSTRAAIELLNSVGEGRQRVLVLGTMRELGDATARCHDEISQIAIQSRADVIAGVGDFADSLRRVAPDEKRVVVAPTVADLWPLLEPHLKPGAVILLKASRGVQLEQIVPQLTTWANA